MKTLLVLLMGTLLPWMAPAPPVIAQPDITNPYLPHTADSVLYDYYAWYDPAHVSDNQLGLEGCSWHSGDERTGQLFPPTGFKSISALRAR